MAVWIILHVVSMFVAFAFTVGVGIYLTAIADTKDVRVIRAAANIARPLQVAGAVVLLAGVIFGFAAASAMGLSVESRWLSEAYVLVGLLFVVGVGVHQSWTARLARAANASPDDHASPELTAVLGDRMVRIAGPVSGLIWIALITLMIVRPS